MKASGLALVCGVAVALGCGGEEGSPADAGVPVDGDVPGDGTVRDDATIDPDAGPLGIDADEDGVPSELDCDDTDASIGRDSTRSCTSDCDIGTQTCTDGVWSECDASTDCACDTPGMMRTIDCGRCGIASQRCGDDGVWEMPSECFDEKECFAGEIQREMEMCGERSRICDDTCHWRDWEVMTPSGECEPGDVERTPTGCPAGEVNERRCSDSCEWDDLGCVAGCLRDPMPSMSGADPVCIPEGDFILGYSGFSESSPVRTITLSEFYIDRLPVTKARYEMCRTAGGCGDPVDLTEYDALAADDFVEWIGMDDILGFCTWDGGALVTEFQWEKAARGPAPDMRRHAWGDDPAEDCRYHSWSGCPDYPFPVSSFPMNVSPYGVRLMGALLEQTASRHMDYDDIPAVDPVGSSDPSARYMIRGNRWYWLGMGGTTTSASSASFRVENYGFDDNGFRCAY